MACLRWPLALLIPASQIPPKSVERYDVYALSQEKALRSPSQHERKVGVAELGTMAIMP